MSDSEKLRSMAEKRNFESWRTEEVETVEKVRTSIMDSGGVSANQRQDESQLSLSGLTENRRTLLYLFGKV